MSRLFGSASGRRGSTPWPARRSSPPPGRLPPSLFDLRDRLAAAFSLAELRDLAFTTGIEPESVPDDTRPLFALGLARAAWCRGCLSEVLAEAARLRPARDWSLPALPPPPAERCEEDPLPRPSVFGDSRQVAMFVLPLLAAAAAVAVGLWWARQPRPMTADFNIAVAAVDVDKLAGRADAAELGDVIQHQIVAIINGQLDEINAQDTEVSGDRLPVVRTSDSAQALAEQVNAQLVVYGEAYMMDETVYYTPYFYVALDTVRADVGEMQGEAALELLLKFPVEDLLAGRQPTGRTADAATLLTTFVRALVNLNEEEIDKARAYIEAAVAHTERYAATYGPFAGREVVYVFASHIARLQADQLPAGSAVRQSHLAAAEAHVTRALEIKPNYGRGVIAKANLFYDQAKLNLALPLYEEAAALRGQPADDLIDLKAALGLGNGYLWQMDDGQARPCFDERQRYADRALGHYATVILAFAAAPEPQATLHNLAGQAFFYSGQVYRLCAENEAARTAFRAALAMKPRPAVRKQIETHLAGLPRREE